MKIKFIAKGYEPFLPEGIVKKVIGFYRKQPIVIDNTGVQLRLNIKKHYKIIK